MLIINIKTQTLDCQGSSYSISSAKNGVGEKEGSFCTPSGRFRVAEKIGKGLATGAVLVGRVATGEVYSQDLAKQYPDRDWILTRILWLDGLDRHNQNTQARYIYIHGTSDNVEIGTPSSKGCIRMKNDDMIEVFDKISVDDIILIQ